MAGLICHQTAKEVEGDFRNSLPRKPVNDPTIRMHTRGRRVLENLSSYRYMSYPKMCHFRKKKKN